MRKQICIKMFTVSEKKIKYARSRSGVKWKLFDKDQDLVDSQAVEGFDGDFTK